MTALVTNPTPEAAKVGDDQAQRAARLRAAIDHLDQAALLSCNGGGWFENEPWEWAQDIANEAAQARSLLCALEAQP